MTAPTHSRLLRLGLVVALGVVLGGLPAAPAVSQTPGEANGTVDCTDRLEVLLLMDESASLKSTDPENRRVEAADVLVRSLAASAEASGGSVNLTIAGFGSAAAEVGGATLPGGTEEAVGLVRTFTTRTEERNTDYVLALLYAVDHFRALGDVPPECKRLVWFTDGAYSIDDVAAPGLATYTSSTDQAAFLAEFGGQICGPLPAPSRLTSPVSEQIRAVGLVVQLVDFRVPGRESPTERREREVTAPVIDRLLGGDGTDPCRVRGGRVEAGQAAALADEFFAQGQIALGRRVVACSDLTTGYPAALVRAVSARGNPGTTVSILRDDQAVASGSGFATYSAPADGPADGRITAGASGGSLSGCYADLGATIVPVGTPTVVAGASTSLIRVGVRGAVGAGDPSALLGPDAVAVTALAGGAPVGVEWQEETRTWQLAVPGPLQEAPELVVSASTPGWGPLVAAPLDVVLQGAPPPPRVVWSGPTTLEGAGTFPGRLTVLPGAVTGGSVCVTFGVPTSDAPGVAVLVDATEACGGDDAPFDIAAEIVVDGDRNAEVRVTLPYTASYRPAGTAESQPLDGAGDAVFPALVLTKPADAGTTALITFVVVLLSALVPLGVLLALVNRQRRLPDPEGRTVATLALVSDEGALHLAPGAVPGTVPRVPLDGTRNRYDLPLGMTVARTRTLNPFAGVEATVTSDRGPVAVIPWMRLGEGRSVRIPAQFGHLVILHSPLGSPDGTAIVVAPRDATPEDTLAAVTDALARTNRLWDRVRSALALPERT
jgi:hypothetical protein